MDYSYTAQFLAWAGYQVLQKNTLTSALQGISVTGTEKYVVVVPPPPPPPPIPPPPPPPPSASFLFCSPAPPHHAEVQPGDRQKSVFRCRVLGSKACGKSAFVRGLVGKEQVWPTATMPSHSFQCSHHTLLHCTCISCTCVPVVFLRRPCYSPSRELWLCDGVVVHGCLLLPSSSRTQMPREMRL